MNQIPETENAVVLRTDFSDDAAWKSVCAAIQKPVGDFRAHVDFVSDPAYGDLTVAQLLSLIPEGFKHSFVFVVDRATLSQPQHPILVVDLLTEPGRTFRVIPSAMWGVENNLTLANMDFADFAGCVDQDGVFRGFPEM